MNITVTQLKDLILAATVSIKVATPCNDYYARQDEVQFDTLEYICPRQFIAALEELK